MFLGVNLGHDSSISLHEPSGRVILAITEERLNRIKGFWGMPRLSLDLLGREYSQEIDEVIVGSHSVFRPESYLTFKYILDSKPKNFFNLANYLIPISYLSDSKDLNHSNTKDISDIKEWFASCISSELIKRKIQAQISFQNHHDSHAFSSVVGSGYDNALVVTLDGEGDYESGTVSTWSNRILKPILRISRNLSLGNFYSEVTKRYGFKKIRHEGKITGLAARGNPGITEKVLNHYLFCEKGKFIKDKTLRGKYRDISNQIENHDNRNFEEALIDILAITSAEFADLAAATQANLEINVLQFISHWKKELRLENLCLSGGVFANVKLNQRIIEELGFKGVYVYPNMRDAGLAVGAVWGTLIKRGSEVKSHENLFLGLIGAHRTNTFSDKSKFLARKLQEGALIGIFRGRSEWGPRALCNRSIIASPTIIDISHKLNLRLKRNDFMPFAPIVSERMAGKVFQLSESSHPSNYASMTTTCHVQPEYREKLREVTNVDGTSRPQIISRNDAELNLLLDAHYEETGCPVLINTSFNLHEQPIVEDIQQAIDALVNQIVDLLILNGEVIDKFGISKLDLNLRY